MDAPLITFSSRSRWNRNLWFSLLNRAREVVCESSMIFKNWEFYHICFWGWTWSKVHPIHSDDSKDHHHHLPFSVGFSLVSVDRFLKIIVDSWTTFFVLFGKTNQRFPISFIQELLMIKDAPMPLRQRKWSPAPFHSLRRLFFGICGPIFKNYEWFINYILFTIQPNKPENSSIASFGVVNDQRCIHSSQMTAMITTTFSQYETAFLGYLWINS